MINTKGTKLVFFSLMIGILLISDPAISQRSIGIGTREPNANAALQIVAPGNDQGILIPGLTSDQRLNTSFVSRLSEAENGLLVFDRDEQRFYYWMTDRWQAVLSGTFSQIVEAGEGIEIIGSNEIVNIGDTDSTNDITNSTLASGELEGTFPELTIVPAAVVTEKLADGAVTTLKIADNTILPQDMASPGAGKVLVTTNAGTIFWENQSLFGITFLQQGRVYVGDSGNQPSEVDMRGEGNILVGNGTSATSVLVNGDVSLSSTGNVDIQPNAVGSSEIDDLSIITDDIAIDAVTNDKIDTDAVGSDEIQDNSIVNIDVNTGANIAGTKINPDFGSQNISTTGSLSASSAVFAAKATAEATLDTDPAATLTTKSYVDDEIVSISNNLEDGDGIVNFSYNGSSPETISIDAGQGLGFDAGQLAISPGPGLDFDASDNLQVSGVTSDMITDGTITNDDLSSSLGLQISQIQNLGDARIIVGDATTNNAVVVSGDANLDAAGQLSLTSNAAVTLGLGTLAGQDANTVSISGGSITGITDLTVADGGTGASTAANARTNLGLGTLAVQNANSLTVTGGSIDGSAIGDTDPEAGTFTTLTATTITGNGSSLTNLNASNIASGTLDGNRLPDIITPGTSVNVKDITVDSKGRVTLLDPATSDRRLKEKIKPLKPSLESVKELKTYSYFLKNRPQLGLQYGLMAQELMEFYPILVSERRDGFLTVDYEMLIPILIKAIQEQQEQIEILRSELANSYGQAVTSEVDQLKQENKQLRQEIEAIKAALGMQSGTDSQ